MKTPCSCSAWAPASTTWWCTWSRGPTRLRRPGPWHPVRLVTSQRVGGGVLGFAFGVPLAVGASALAGFVVPEFVTLFQWQSVIGVLGIVVLMSLAASYLPIHRIARIAPTSVFRAG